MTKDKVAFGFKINRIETEQFAILEDAYDEKERVQFNYTFSFGADQEQKIIGAFTSYRFLINDKPFIIFKAGCYFSLNNALWDSLKIQGTNQLNLDKKLMRHLMTITVGTSRGILHSKTENTPFNKFVIPTLNVEESIKEDMVIE